jgi:VWFA-related protein
MQKTAIVTSLVLLGAAVVLPAEQAPRDQARPTFRLGVNYVEVDTTVTDAGGRFLRDLTADDFQVFEDGVPQDVSVFSLIDIPVDRDDRPLFRDTPVVSDVFSNDRGLEGRVYLIVLDDLHIDGLRTGVVRRAAQAFVDQYLGANDVAAVVHVGRPEANQALTFSKPLLRQSIAKFSGKKLPSRTINRLRDMALVQELQTIDGEGASLGFVGPPMDMDSAQRLAHAGTTLGAIENLSRFVSRMQGRRKAFVFFSEGIDYDLENPMADTFSGLRVGTEISTVNMGLREMLQTATRANVSIYPVDPRGLIQGLTDAPSSLGSLPVTYYQCGDDCADPLPSSALLEAENGLRDELEGSLDSLRMLASETGGLAAINTNDFDRPFRRIVEDNSSYYLLGYYPTNTARNGSFRRVTVDVRRPGAEVRARRGYFAARAGDEAVEAPTTAVDAVHGVAAAPVATTGLSMRVVPQVLLGPAGVPRVHLTVEMPGGAIPMRPTEELFTNELLMVWTVTDADGNQRASVTREATFRLLPSTHQRAEEAGWNMTAEFDLPAGEYQLRVAGLEQLSGRSGSIIGDLVVPRFSTATLALSSLVVGVPTSKVQFALSEGAGALTRLLPVPPTSRREFGANEELAIYTELYDNDERPHVVDISVRVLAEDGRQLFVAEDERDRRELAGRVYGHFVTLPLRQFQPGRYILSVEARSRLGTEVKRETEIVVR